MTKIAACPAARVLIRAARPGDIERIRDILNTEILTSTASWTTAARTSQAMTDWSPASCHLDYLSYLPQCWHARDDLAVLFPFQQG